MIIGGSCRGYVSGRRKSIINGGRCEIATLSSDGDVATIDSEKLSPVVIGGANSGSTWKNRSVSRVMGSSALMRLPSRSEVSKRDRYSGYIAYAEYLYKRTARTSVHLLLVPVAPPRQCFDTIPSLSCHRS